MTGKDAGLYGIPRPKKTQTKEISSTTTLAFSSQLAALIESKKSPANSAASSGRPRPTKPSIFATQNRNINKRALKDLEPDNRHGGSEKGSKLLRRRAIDVDAEAEAATAAWQRSRRKMEDKARLYGALKRGEVEDGDERHLVDFDRKWAEHDEKGSAGSEVGDDDNDDGNASDDEDEAVEYIDEFGRTRLGTAQEAANSTRQAAQRANAGEPSSSGLAGRPAAPASIIYGDVVQSEAFDPDGPQTRYMAALAEKRDRPATPPPELHFDGGAEVRAKGVGFFRFAADADVRADQMAALECERARTVDARASAAAAVPAAALARQKIVDARRDEIRRRRVAGQADRFLDQLTDSLQREQPAPTENTAAQVEEEKEEQEKEGKEE